MSRRIPFGAPIVNAAQMRAAEQAVIDGGVSVDELMERAGLTVAREVGRLAGGRAILIAAGPGNNGGDAYVAARHLTDWRLDVTVASLGTPKAGAAARMRARWSGRTEPIEQSRHRPVFVDGLFGTGGMRALDNELAFHIDGLRGDADISIAIDLPSGVDADGIAENHGLSAHVTIALGALKRGHLVGPGADHCGHLLVADIGVPVASAARTLRSEPIAPPDALSQKFTRGMVMVVAGAMPGAALLAATAAMAGGAGYVTLAASADSGIEPHALVRRAIADAGDLASLLDDERIGAVVIGPGLGRDDRARALLDRALASPRDLVIDADALSLLGREVGERIAADRRHVILTPHSGEFERLFGDGGGDKIDRTLAAARSTGATIVHKGADTVIASPDGKAVVSAGASSWLSTAGTGDVLAGLIGARHAANRRYPAEAAEQAVWWHAAAAGLARPPFAADDLVSHLPAAMPTRRRVVSAIVRVAARGDGVTADGRHAAFAAPGDTLTDAGEVVPGPHHQAPPCRHFPACGGCQLQHLDDVSYAGFVNDRVAGALAGQGLAATIRAPHVSPPRARRRATLHAEAKGGRVRIGFSESRSHAIVDLVECWVLAPSLFALVAPLRVLLQRLGLRRRAGLAMTLTDQGADLLIDGLLPTGLAAAETVTDFCERHALARLSFDDGLGAETRWEPRPVTVTLGGCEVPFPAGGFLQATADGEAALVATVREAVGAAAATADLFAGLGTFALALPGKVYAAEGARDASLSLRVGAARAGRTVFVEHRDLYRRPLTVAELDRFDAVVLDPPRAGARDQVAALATATGPRAIAYVSCNPSRFAADAKTLCEGGWRLDWVQPVGQFTWSTHVELAARFTRPDSAPR